jgi:hypothetical protein
MPDPLVTHIYTADPSAHVFEGKIYVYPSHVSTVLSPKKKHMEKYIANQGKSPPP